MVKPTNFTEQGTLDDCALTLRDVLRDYKSELVDMRRRGSLPNPSGFNILNHAGVELHISQRLINLFLVEEALEK
jgi:hypothetical protein